MTQAKKMRLDFMGFLKKFDRLRNDRAKSPLNHPQEDSTSPFEISAPIEVMESTRGRQKTILGILIFLILVLFSSGTVFSETRELADFEKRLDMRWLAPKGSSLEWVQNQEAATSGKSVVCVKLKAGENYPGFEIIPGYGFLKDWTGYDQLCIDFFNPGDQSLTLFIRMDDAKSTNYNTRYNSSGWGMRPGKSTLKIPFSSLVIEDRSRLLDVSKIKGVYFFSNKQNESFTYYVDSIRLEQQEKIDLGSAGEYYLDFGLAGSPVFQGFQQVIPEKTYSESDGYGFLSTGEMTAMDLGVPDPLAQDVVMGNIWRPYEYGFGVATGNGRYEVRVIARHISPSLLPTLSGWITAEGKEVYRRDIGSEKFYSSEILFKGLDRPYSRGQDVYAKFFSPDLDWIVFPVQVQDGKLNLIFKNLAVSALVVYPESKRSEVEKKLAKIDQERRKYFDENIYFEETRSAPDYNPTSQENERGFVSWIVPFWETLDPESRPPDDRKNESRLLVTKGEYEPITIGLLPLRDLSHVYVEIKDAENAQGDWLPSSQFDIRWVQYRETKRSKGIYTAKESYLTPSYYFFPFQSGVARRLWITLHVPGDQPPGIYRTEIEITSGSGEAKKIPLEIEVLPLVLPEKSDLLVAWYYRDPGGLNYHYNSFKEKMRRLDQIELEMRDMKAHGANSLEFPPPEIKNVSAKGEIEFDLSAWDDYAELCRKVGIGFEHPPQTFIIDIANRLKQSGLKEGTESFRTAYRQAVAKLGQWSLKEKLPIVLWVVDEPREQLQNSWNRNFADTEFLLQALKDLPGVKTTVTPMADVNSGVDYTPLVKSVDVMQTHPWSDSKRLIQMSKENGVPVWNYNAGVDRLSFGFHPWATGAEGRYQWHYAFWNNAYNIFQEGWGVTFPSPEGPLPTPEYERSREGIEDYRWLGKLEALLKTSSDQALNQEAQELLQTIQKEVPEFLDYTLQTGQEAGKSYEGELNLKMADWREKILRILVQLES